MALDDLSAIVAKSFPSQEMKYPKTTQMVLSKFVSSTALILLISSVAAIHAAAMITNIAQGCDASQSLFLSSDGTLWAMGYNEYGQLGDGTFNNTNKPEVILASNVVTVAAGYQHSLFLKSDGSLWAMGGNTYGQLGDGTFNNTNQPEEIVTNDVTAIAAGGGQSLFVKSDGSLWAMGENTFGQLGDGTLNRTNRPEEIVSGNVVAIAAGAQFTLFLKSDGSLWAMGYNYFGQLGDGTDGARASRNQPEQIIASGVTAIAAGAYHSLFLKSDGSLWAMGYNAYGQLGDGTLNVHTNQPKEILASNVVAVAAGAQHSLFLKNDGSLWATGDNVYGELGDGTFPGTNQPQEIVAENVIAIAAGDYHSLFLKSDGSLWAVGGDMYGQLGDGFSPNGGTPTPEQIVPSPQPILISTISSQTNLQFKATCLIGGNFYLLAATNFAQPLCQWTRILTNSVTVSGTNNYSATITNLIDFSNSKMFYILQSD